MINKQISMGHLISVDLREVWATEHEDFTPWLAQNLDFLGEVLGIEMELEAEEKTVGSFRADILARDITTYEWVLIENQLERTDHSHLGQLITYASGLQAATIIWVASQFADEHIAALDWLNVISDDSIRFFGIQIELWRINEVIAPRFHVVSKPNSWKRKGKNYTKTISLSVSPRAIVISCLRENPNLTLVELRRELRMRGLEASEPSISRYRKAFRESLVGSQGNNDEASQIIEQSE